MNKNIDDYWNTYREIYSFEESLKVYRERKALEFLESLGDDSMEILEIGFGFTPVFASFPKFRRYVGVEPGLDPYLAALEESANDNRVELKHGYFSEWSAELSGYSFDAIVVTAVLGEVDNAFKFLQSLGNLMEPKTTVYVNVANSNSMHRIIGMAAGLLPSLDDFSERQAKLGARELFNLHKLEQAISSALPKVEILNSGSFFLKPFTHDQMDAALQSGALTEDVLESLYLASKHFPDFGAELFAVFRRKIE